jgi:tetratricopeptide (TPR) repeat protein
MKFSRSLFSLENLLDHILRTFEEEPPLDLEKKKSICIDILCSWSTLLVLDNMETVGDGRIMAFIQNLPPDIKAKVLLTSRQKTGSWELPLPVNELSVDEVKEFIEIRSNEMGINCFNDSKIIEDIWKASGGLPLAIQWILGRCKLEGRYDSAIADVSKKDSPVLEFSFGNIWNVLSMDAKAILAILSIFEEPPTIQQLAVATEFQLDQIEKALTELNEVTLVTRHTQISDGRIRYIALPITLSFAANQLNTMGDFEINCRVRFQKFNEQMNLHQSEISKFRNRFERYGLDSDNEKRAAILCQKGESEMFFGNIENADMLFKQARDLAPQSSYIYAMSASYELGRNRIGAALKNIEEACKRTNKKTGGLCYTIKARAALAQNDKGGCVKALYKATEFNPADPITRHQYGVALSKAGNPEDAIKQFNIIIEEQKKIIPPTTTLLMALKTRMINLKRLNRMDELKNDQAYVSDILSNYPHLFTARVEFDDFLESRNNVNGK